MTALQASAGRDVQIAPPVEAMMQRLEKWVVETPPPAGLEATTSAGAGSREAGDPDDSIPTEADLATVDDAARLLERA